MDPDDLQLLDTYIQRGIALRNQPPEPTLAQLSAHALDRYAAQVGGGPGSFGQSAMPPAFSSQPAGGLYTLGAAALSGDIGEGASGRYEDLQPPPHTPGAGSQSSPLAAQMTRPDAGGAPVSSRLGASGTPNGQSAPLPALRPLPAPQSPAGDPFPQPHPIPSPTPPRLPSPQEQAAAKAMLESQDRTPLASYSDPVSMPRRILLKDAR